MPGTHKGLDNVINELMGFIDKEGDVEKEGLVPSMKLFSYRSNTEQPLKL